jgi:galactokinase
MDQYAAVHATANHAILLDCRSLTAKSIPLVLKGYTVVICNSKIRHALASSEYNRRRTDCERGVELLHSSFPSIHSLRDVSPDEFKVYQSALPEQVLRRCRHVIGENLRTLRAADALSSGNITEVGRLLSASHKSLRDDYQVSCPELDLLVEGALSQPGVSGARMTGGGFGGCTVNLVDNALIQQFREEVTRIYRAKTSITPDIFTVAAGNGAEEINN